MGISCPLLLQTIHSRIPILHNYTFNPPNPNSRTSSPKIRPHSVPFIPSQSFFYGNFKFHRRKVHIRHCHPKNPKFTVRASIESPKASSKAKILVSSAVTVVFAIANRVLYKLALVPMKEYPFFLAQITTFGYVAIYFSVLYIRYCAGIVTYEMMALPKSRFMAIGALEALGVVSGMCSGAMLPGPAIPILSQTFLVWQLGFSTLLLRKRYSLNQIAGCLLVAFGVVVAVASGSDAGQMLSGVGFVWPALMIASSAFQAGSSILKESVFVDAATRLKGKLLDIFVVNSFGSGFQVVTDPLYYPCSL